MVAIKIREDLEEQEHQILFQAVQLHMQVEEVEHQIVDQEDLEEQEVVEQEDHQDQHHQERMVLLIPEEVEVELNLKDLR
jgi:hypothetical protein